jgi:ketosteroid isomerase-like protein
MGEPSRDASTLIEEGVRLLLAQDMLGFADLWAEDGTMEFPFAPRGAPRLLEGRAAVREYLRHYTDHMDVRAVPKRTVHVTTDPNVAIAELEVTGVAMATGRDYRLAYVAVVTARDGEIAHYRDYWDPLAAQEVMGGTAGEPSPFPEGGAAA